MLRGARVFRTSQYLKHLTTQEGKPGYYDFAALDPARVGRMPYCIRVLLENAVRNCDEFAVTSKNVDDILGWEENYSRSIEIPFKPARVILQDFTGVPAVVDLASMRDCVKRLGADPSQINPLIPVDLVIDHSVQVDFAGIPDAAERNQQLEFERNQERFKFLKWGSKAFDNLKIVPPGSGIVHQVNLEFLARCVFNHNNTLYPDTLVGTDSHTTMVNALGVLGWGVGGIEAEAAMLGQPLSLVLPEVVGYKLTGAIPQGTTATDVVLTITQELRKLGVVGKFVEFYGPGCESLTLADKATISNMAPEYGATCGFFPVDSKTLEYLRMSGRTEAHIQRVESYLQATGMFNTGASDTGIKYSAGLELDLSTVEPCLSGPKRPHDRVLMKDLQRDFKSCLEAPGGHKGFGLPEAKRSQTVPVEVNGSKDTLKNGATVVAAITSCTNTSNPAVLIQAGLVAQRAAAKGMKVKPYVKTSLSPGSQVVNDYLKNSGLLTSLDELGFNITGFGCMTCIGNSGDLLPPVAAAIDASGLVASAVLSGNRNFEARIHPLVQANYLASPPLVVAYSLAGTVDINLETDPLGKDASGNDVYLKDLWPSGEDVQKIINSHVTPEAFARAYEHITDGDKNWQALKAPADKLYPWDDNSTYIHNPPFFADLSLSPAVPKPIQKAQVLLHLGDSVTTDHISPAGNIAKNSPAAQFLESKGIERKDFNTYGSRRGNDQIMMRGTFANIAISNALAGSGRTGPVTVHIPSGEKMSVYDASVKYQAAGTPLIVIAGKEYGCGSSRDWAAKGTMLLGIKAVIAESYERIHRSNLVGMGVVPLQFKDGQSAATLGLDATDTFDIDMPALADLSPGMDIPVKSSSGKNFAVTLRFDTLPELKYYENGGILNYVLRQKIGS